LAKTKTRPVQVLLTDEAYRKLECLAQAEGLSRSSIMRRCIRNAYLMMIQNTPTCSNGAACFVPHMHHFAPISDPVPSALAQEIEPVPGAQAVADQLIVQKDIYDGA